MIIYKADAEFSDEYLQILNEKAKAYPIGTEIYCLDGVVLVRAMEGFKTKN